MFLLGVLVFYSNFTGGCQCLARPTLGLIAVLLILIVQLKYVILHYEQINDDDDDEQEEEEEEEEDMISCFDTLHERDRQQDRQTDGHTPMTT